MRDQPGVDLRADLRHGLPFADASVDALVAIHVLQDLAWSDLQPAVEELHRVMRPGGALRLGLPDLERALCAFAAGNAGYFHVPDEHARSIGAKLVTQIIWYGSVRTPFTFDFAKEWLLRAGFEQVLRCRFGESAGPAWLAALDNRERESLFVEARA
jgi:predicted SAM-dependent methyltransferase